MSAARIVVLTLAALCLTGTTVSRAENPTDTININADSLLPPNIESRILNGNKAGDTEFPHQAAILFNKILVCGGSIINNRDVVTAASCVTNPDGSLKALQNFRIGVGETNLNFYNNTNTFAVATILVHKNYNPSTKLANIAFIRVNGSFQYSDKVFPAQLTNAISNTTCDISGFGQIWDSPLAPNMQHLYYGEVQYVTCRNISPLPNTGVFCGLSNTTDVCTTDVGGPVICDGKLMGLVSHSNCKANSPAVFTSIPGYISWLQEAVNGVIVSGSSRTSSGITTSLLCSFGVVWFAKRYFF